MLGASKEYISSLIPNGLPDGRKILQDGIEAGKDIEAGRGQFVKDGAFDNFVELWIDCNKKGELYWASNIGLATIEEEKAGIEEVYEYCKRLNIKYHSTLAIPSTAVAIPKELRKQGMKNTSYVLESLEDSLTLSGIKGLEVMQIDQTLGVPNAWETAINNIKAGSFQAGCISQLLWNHPGCDDHVKYVTEMLKAMGVIATKSDEGFGISGYCDDTFPSYCEDAVAYVGFALFENYIVKELCGARFTIAYGGLVSDVVTRSALLKAFKDLFYTDEQPPILFVQANTTRYWDHDLVGNYGMLCQEMLMAVLAERHYKTGAAILPVPVTEKIHVPTVEVIKDMLVACARLEENIDQWEEVIDFTKIDERAEVLKREGTKFFENMLSTLSEAGLDVKDPLHMLMFIKNFNPGLFEETFHPSVRETGELKTYFPTDMAKMTLAMVAKEEARLEEMGLKDSLKGTKILIASADAHVYGLRYVKKILQLTGAEIIDAGVDASVPYILDIAEEESVKYIGVSTHNGQALGIANQLVDEMEKRGTEYSVFMGGVLNTILPGHSVPSDVTDMINQKGVLANNDLIDVVQHISAN